MVSRLPEPALLDGDDGVSQVPGGPPVACPALTTPVDPRCQASTASTVLPSHSRTGSASTKSDFGADHTACNLAVYASPLRLPPRRKTRFRLAANLGRTGFSPARSDRKVSEISLPTHLRHLFPFPQASPGAHLALNSRSGLRNTNTAGSNSLILHKAFRPGTRYKTGTEIPKVRIRLS